MRSSSTPSVSVQVRRHLVPALALAALAGAAGSALGQNFELVPSTAGAAQTGQLNSLTQTAGRTYQFTINASQLTQIRPGWEIVGLQFRLDEAATGPWPAADATFADFEIRVAAANNEASTFSTTFANNASADERLVRDGALTWTANSWPGGAAVNGFGPIIPFTSPYRYAGTNAVFTIRHSGQTGGGAAVFLDGTPQGAAPVGSTVNAAFATGQTATIGSLTSFCAVRVIFRPVPVSNAAVVPPTYAVEPGTVNQLTIAGGNPLTQLLIMSPTQFAGMPPGSTITGVQFRNASGVTAVPAAGVLIPSLRLQLSSTNSTPASFSTTVAANLLADSELVYSNTPAIGAGAFDVASGGVHAFGPDFAFPNGFVYKGGNLAMVLRRGATATSFSTDAISISDPNTGQRFVARSLVGDANATETPTATGFPVMKFNFEPATVIPNEAARTEAAGSISVPITNAPFTSQIIIAPEQLRHIPRGSLIEAMSMRLDGGATDWPVGGDAVFTDYTVRLSTAARQPATMSNVVAVNEGADVTVVRTGPLVVGSLDYPRPPVAGFPNDYGPTIRFDRPFVYNGGALCLTLRHSGNNRGFNFLDAVPTGDPRFGVQFRHAATGNDASATTLATTFNMPVLRLHFTSGGYAPRARASSDGNSENNVPLRDSPYTYQIVLAESELLANSIRPGSLITSLGFRLEDTRTSFPSQQTAQWTRYDVALSTSRRTPATWSTSFASNEGLDRVVVREGPLSIRELQMQGDGAPGSVNRATFRMNFTRPFLYQGGPLCITVRHDGSNISSVTEVDAASGAGDGFGTLIAGGHAVGSGAIVATSFTSAPIPLLSSITPPPACLADIVSIGGSPPPDGLLTGDDFNAFIAAFASESLLADICGVGGPPSLPDGLLTGDDFNAYIASFAAGCP
jgi:hypothetical protein